ncbi:GAF domain-containing protein [Pseudomonas sp. MAFF 730085]|uniref:histidine kinase n=1 Tax=Pseudomonas kitaguniensis TaxID=2607908 RepID=A0A5N7JSM1_9PSED|nr:HWE histidine kinase domain-containing protein [Pseudomonas kitaguniensis]MPQ84351.1 GAF domain-containing protein [Pseudomonas kitaguniensis]
MHQLLEQLLNRALDVMSSGSPAVPLLGELASLLQGNLPGCVVGINVLDKPGRTFRHSIFPNLPDEFARELEGNVITGKRGSCGLGVLTGQIVNVPDVANDERFSDEWKALFAQYGLASLVSIPALSADGEAHGSLAIIHPPAAPLAPEQINDLKPVAALCAKICAYSRTRETTQFLLGELEHRIRNLYMTVGGLANLTIKSYPDPGKFRSVFGERLTLMHRAHSLAFSEREMGLAQLINEMLAPYTQDYAISINGPDINLTPDAACALALAINELGTNASKYGALSKAGGMLTVNWNIVAMDESGAGTAFKLQWTERSGPTVLPPTRQGYGTRMISGTLSNAFDGRALFSFEQEGLSCEISAPFSAKLSSEHSRLRN